MIHAGDGKSFHLTQVFYRNGMESFISYAVLSRDNSCEESSPIDFHRLMMNEQNENRIEAKYFNIIRYGGRHQANKYFFNEKMLIGEKEKSFQLSDQKNTY